MKKTIIISLLAFSFKIHQSQEITPEQFGYAFGINLYESLQQDGVSDLHIESIAKGMQDAQSSATTLSSEEALNVIRTYFKNISDGIIAAAQEKELAFLEANAKREGVVSTNSGLQYEVIELGEGAKPTATSTVETHYHGTHLDGTVFDSSVERGQPATFPLNRVIPGWTEGLQLMSVGSKFKFFIPAHLAYGEKGSPPVIGPGETLIFEVELISIQD